MMTDIVLAAPVRTPVGAYNGGLAPLSAVELGSLVIAECLKRAGLPLSGVDEVIMGNILQAGLGQNPARQAAVRAKLPIDMPSYTVNKLCGSGLKSVMLAAQAIASQSADVIVAGGMESMTNAPYVLAKARWGYRMGNADLIDTMVHDGLTDAFDNQHMGITAENLAERHKISREEQDAFACASQAKALAAIQSGAFKDEIMPVTIAGKKGDVVFDTDEHPRSGVTVDSLAKLRPAFKKDGTVTAGNASGINDGAAAVLVLSAARARELGVTPMARIVAYASGAVEPHIMGFGPVPRHQESPGQGRNDRGRPGPHRGQRSLRGPMPVRGQGAAIPRGQTERQRWGHCPGPSHRGQRGADSRHPAPRHEQAWGQERPSHPVHRRWPGRGHDRGSGLTSGPRDICISQLPPP